MCQGAPWNSPQHTPQVHPLLIPLEAMLERTLKPSDIVTKKSFENAIVLVNALGGESEFVAACHLDLKCCSSLSSLYLKAGCIVVLGGSTNAVLHLLAIAATAGAPWQQCRQCIGSAVRCLFD